MVSAVEFANYGGQGDGNSRRTREWMMDKLSLAL